MKILKYIFLSLTLAFSIKMLLTSVTIPSILGVGIFAISTYMAELFELYRKHLDIKNKTETLYKDIEQAKEDIQILKGNINSLKLSRSGLASLTINK